MISAIINFSIRNKLLVGLMLSRLIAWGVFLAANLPLDAIPDVTNNPVQVITQSPELAAQEVEQLITVPLELRTIPGVMEIRSISRFGLSVITVVFEKEMDTYHTRQLVAEKLKTAEAELGQGLGTPGMAPITTGLGEIYQYTLKAKPGYEKNRPSPVARNPGLAGEAPPGRRERRERRGGREQLRRLRAAVRGERGTGPAGRC